MELESFQSAFPWIGNNLPKKQIVTYGETFFGDENEYVLTELTPVQNQEEDKKFNLKDQNSINDYENSIEESDEDSGKNKDEENKVTTQNKIGLYGKNKKRKIKEKKLKTKFYRPLAIFGCVKCRHALFDVDQRNLFDNYLRMDNFLKRFMYIDSLITAMGYYTVKNTYKYNVYLNNDRKKKLCKSCFMICFDENISFINNILKQKPKPQKRQITDEEKSTIIRVRQGMETNFQKLEKLNINTDDLWEFCANEIKKQEPELYVHSTELIKINYELLNSHYLNMKNKKIKFCKNWPFLKDFKTITKRKRYLLDEENLLHKIMKLKKIQSQFEEFTINTNKNTKAMEKILENQSRAGKHIRNAFVEQNVLIGEIMSLF